jgi:hypothetical protein
LRTSSSLSTTVPSAPPWGAPRGLVQRSPAALLYGRRDAGRGLSWTTSREPPQPASSRGPGTRRRAPVRRHGRRPGPRLERDSTSWPRRSEARGTWRRSRSDGPTDWCSSDAVAAQGDFCVAWPRSVEWRASGVAGTSGQRPDALSASRSTLASCGPPSLPLAIVHGPLPRPRMLTIPRAYGVFADRAVREAGSHAAVLRRPIDCGPADIDASRLTVAIRHPGLARR